MKFKILSITAIMAIFYIFKPLLLFFIPGILLLFFYKKDLIKTILLIIASSISFWIVSFWFLKYIPISLSSFFYLIFIICLIGLLFLKQDKIKIKRGQLIVLIIITIVSLLRFMPFFLGYFPASADMSFHTLTTKIITLNNKVPFTYEPILNVKFGGYPVGFHILSSYFSILSKSSEYKSTLFIANFSYAFLLLAVYILLKNYFDEKISLIGSITTLFMANNPQFFISWGGNPFVLSLGLMIFCIPYLNNFFKLKRIERLLLALFASASILTHPMPVYGFFYAYLAIFILNYIKDKPHHVTFIKSAFIVSLLVFIFIVPYLFNYDFDISQNEKDFQQNRNDDKFLSWKGDISNLMITIPNFLFLIFGNKFMLLLILSLIILTNDKKLFQYIIIMSVSITILILNSKYKILPFSYVLFSERIAILFIIPFSICIGYLFEKLFDKEYIKNNITKNEKMYTYSKYIFIVLLVIISFQNLQYYNYISDHFSMVTPADNRAMKWIKENTKEDAYFLNNYGDAGLWIPALTLRRITNMQTPPVYLDEKVEFDNNNTPDYVYFGDKKVYNTNLMYEDYEQYKKVYSDGAVTIFKLR